MQVPIVQYDAKYVPNPNPQGETAFEEFWKVREAVLTTCRRFGTAGPDLSYGSKLDYDVQYWVIDDQHNDDLYQNMEVVEPGGWSSEWMLGLMVCLKRHSGWGISIANTDQGHLLVFADRILVTGPTFANCTDLESVVSAAKCAAENLKERRTGPLKRQLAYVSRQLPSAMAEADRSGYAYIATFNGYQLHESCHVVERETNSRQTLFAVA